MNEQGGIRRRVIVVTAPRVNIGYRLPLRPVRRGSGDRRRRGFSNNMIGGEACCLARLNWLLHQNFRRRGLLRITAHNRFLDVY